MKFIKKHKSFWTLKDGITQSMIAEFLACRERATLAYKKGWSSQTTSNALTFGTLCHSVLEENYLQLSRHGEINTEAAIGQTCTAYKKLIETERLWTPDDEQALEMNKGYLEALLPVYWKLYKEKDSKRKYLAVETAFSNLWGDAVPLRGKIDVVYENAEGEVWIVDHKTKYSLNDETETRLSFDLQGMFYILNWWLLTKKLPKGFVQNIIQRPRLRKGENENLKHFIDRVREDVDASYFKRIQMSITKEEFMFWYEKEFQPIMKDFVGWAKGEAANFRNPVACETRYGCCKFIKVCGVKDYVGLYKRKEVFPELAL